MNYYEHHLGDYAVATAHLSFIEDAAYSRLIRTYYASEQPIPLDFRAAQRLIVARTDEEREAVITVLREFFIEQADGWHNPRCDAEIEHFREKRSKAKRSADMRWSARRPHSDRIASALPTHSDRIANASESYANASKQRINAMLPNPQSPIPKPQAKNQDSEPRDVENGEPAANSGGSDVPRLSKPPSLQRLRGAAQPAPSASSGETAELLPQLPRSAHAPDAAELSAASNQRAESLDHALIQPRADAARQAHASGMLDLQLDSFADASPGLRRSPERDLAMPALSPVAASIERIFEHWRQTFAHPTAKLDAKRSAIISRALKLYSAEQLQRCLDGYARSPHHMGQNDRQTVYDALGLLLRDAEHIDAGLAFLRPQPAQLSHTERARAQLQSQITEGESHGRRIESNPAGLEPAAGPVR